MEGGKPSTQRHSSGAVRPIVLLVVAVSLVAVLFMATRVSPGCRPLLKAVYQQGLGRAGPSVTADPLLGGLLSPGFDDRSCLSRYRASLYRQPSLHNLSSHLVSRLRRYESLHQLCGPGTPAYSHAVARLREAMDGHASAPAPASSNSTSSSDPECSYIIWTPVEGLGNRILSTASAFLYALLTDRVLLVHHPADDLNDMFCEPFPGSNTTWVLPEEGFPIQGIKGLNVRTRESLGNALGRGEGEGSAPWLYVHLQTDYKPDDRRFFCDDGQDTVRGVRWLVLRSDNYFVPGLFFLRRYEEELVRLFPRRDTVFHHLGRYLFHPSNTVWGMATRYYSSYLAPAEERVGVQVREFKYARISADERYKQIISCASRESLLPAVDNATLPSSSDHHHHQEQEQETKRKAVLVVSLNGDYYDKLSSLYYEHGGAAGVTVSVFQPTHLGMQQSEKRQHNQKALAEIVLLSFSDVVVTSAQSTFGYVSQGLAGLRPWVLMLPVDGKVPDPPCRLASTIEPCFMRPPHYDCRTRGDSDNGKVVPYIRQCEDVSYGVQLVE
ncbi:galactoside 2-alpha-L-fucosyltransferase-like [Aegilops tauschii subsp. strangulata]|uniref:Fucosyltransferase n=2 Tax=Aegilops tauschii TaxID=37682 RepID=A0A453DJN6_AEGTS|nr:galactoside 2-alpha-L-fucosyltransferase-like [Aegilops tauschii subsp. strangulata]